MIEFIRRLAASALVVGALFAPAASSAPPARSVPPVGEGRFVSGDGHRVSYAQGATRADAVRLQNQLIEIGYFQAGRTSHVFLQGAPGARRDVLFVTQEGTWNRPEMRRSFRTIAEMLAARLYPKSPLTPSTSPARLRLHLCDHQVACFFSYEVKHTLGVRRRFGNESDVYISSRRGDAHADAIATTLSSAPEVANVKGALMLVTEPTSGVPLVCLAVLDPTVATSPGLAAELMRVGQALSGGVYSGGDVVMGVCNVNLEVLHTLPVPAHEPTL